MNRKMFLKTGLFGWIAGIFVSKVAASPETNVLDAAYKNYKLNKMEFILEDEGNLYNKHNTLLTILEHKENPYIVKLELPKSEKYNITVTKA